MKKALKITGWVIGAIALAIGGFVTYVAIDGVPTFDPPATPKITIKGTPAMIKRGEAIAQLQCIACHADKNNRLTGMHMADVPALFGKIYSKNITQDPEKGIGKWTDGELMYFLRTGIRPNGKLGGFMPTYPLMADEDLKSVIAYLRSDALPVQSSKEEAPEIEYSLFSKLLFHTVVRPLNYPQTALAIPDSTDEISFGRYTANAVADCYGCHSGSLTDQNKEHPELSAGFYGGGIEMIDDQSKPIFTANLTFDEKTGIGKKYTKEQFIRVLKQGVRPDGSVLRYPMAPRPALTDKEAGAIYEYLKTVPKQNNDIAQKAAEKQLADK